MSEQEKSSKSGWEVLAESMKKISEIQREVAARESARRNTLTPAQRAKEDHERAARLIEARNQKLAKPFVKMGPTVLSRESFTISQFAWLLAGENPDKRGGFWDSELDTAAEEQKRFVVVLNSCVDVAHLRPLNPKDGADEYRFSAIDLIAIARKKLLGKHEILQSLLLQPQKPPPPPALAIPAQLPISTFVKAIQKPTPTLAQKTLAKRGTAIRVKGVTARVEALSAIAAEFVTEGKGKANKEEVQLNTHSKDLNKRFRQKHLEWAGLSDKRLEVYRALCKPPIRLLPGRPALKV